jgi:hypothetical protein
MRRLVAITMCVVGAETSSGVRSTFPGRSAIEDVAKHRVTPSSPHAVVNE